MADAIKPEPAGISTGADGDDVINRLGGLAADAPLARVRAERPDVVRYAQGSFRALLEPDDPAGVSRKEREMIAYRAAALTPSPALAAWHHNRLRAMGTSDAALAAMSPQADTAGLSAREVAILRHTDLLAREPGAATPAHIAALKVAGLTPRDIVTISQLIALVSFQARTLVGLRLLAEETKV
ncbi:MAG: CMD domain protein [Chloroflexota bacterium]|nr:CMD domain protein [Chloroflexota bacterium]